MTGWSEYEPADERAAVIRNVIALEFWPLKFDEFFKKSHAKRCVTCKVKSHAKIDCKERDPEELCDACSNCKHFEELSCYISVMTSKLLHRTILSPVLFLHFTAKNKIQFHFFVRVYPFCWDNNVLIYYSLQKIYFEPYLESRARFPS